MISFSPETQTWSTWADKPGAVSDIQSARIGDQIYVPGGLQANQQPTDQLEVYDPRADRWETRAPLPVPLSDYALAAFEGQLYLFGGWDGENYRSETYQYDPGTDVWTVLTPLASARGGARAVSEGGKIYLLGGTDGKQVFKDSLAYYPQRDLNHESAWEALSPLPEGRAEMGVDGAGRDHLHSGRNHRKQQSNTARALTISSTGRTVADNSILRQKRPEPAWHLSHLKISCMCWEEAERQVHPISIRFTRPFSPRAIPIVLP